MERLLGFDAQLLFDAAVTAVNLFILFFALSYFLFNPVKEFLEKRRERIAGELEEAAAEKKSSKELREQYERKLKTIELEAEDLLSAAEKRGKRLEAEIVSEARENASRIIERAEHEIELKKAKALEEMRQEVVEIAAGMAVKIIAGAMDSRAQKAVIDHIMEQLGDITWQA